MRNTVHSRWESSCCHLRVELTWAGLGILMHQPPGDHMLWGKLLDSWWVDLDVEKTEDSPDNIGRLIVRASGEEAYPHTIERGMMVHEVHNLGKERLLMVVGSTLKGDPILHMTMTMKDGTQLDLDPVKRVWLPQPLEYVVLESGAAG